MEPVLLIDNYDSFTQNLVHLIQKVKDVPVVVMRNDEDFLTELPKFKKIVISPGPGLPEESGDLMKLFDKLNPEQHLLGVCLGHQAIALHYGGKLVQYPNVYHGSRDWMQVCEGENPLFHSLPSRFHVARYHSWGVEQNFPADLLLSAVDDAGQVLAIRHKTLPIFGIQFHPESVLCEYSEAIVENFLRLG